MAKRGKDGRWKTPRAKPKHRRKPPKKKTGSPRAGPLKTLMKAVAYMSAPAAKGMMDSCFSWWVEGAQSWTAKVHSWYRRLTGN